MKSIDTGSIGRNLSLLVLIAVLPALGILLYTGVEQRLRSIEEAKEQVQLVTHSMAEIQFDIIRSARQMLSTLAMLPEVKNIDVQGCNEIFKAVLGQNPDYQNIALTDLQGKVLASGVEFSSSNLKDRMHFQKALETGEFTIGEYIVTRLGDKVPSIAFAYPVLDTGGNARAVLTMSITLARFPSFYDNLDLAKESFIAITDRQGIRLLYYPPREGTNPVGEPIQPKSWKACSQTLEPGIFLYRGTDLVPRIFAFRQVQFSSGPEPDFYMWAGIPESKVLGPANAILARNLLLMLAAAASALLCSWIIGKRTLISPIRELVSVAEKIARGDLEVPDKPAFTSGELGALTRAFHDMAASLAVTLRNIGDGVITTDTQSRILLMSRGAETITGWNVNQAVGRPLTDVINTVDTPADQNSGNPVDKVLASGQTMDLAGPRTLISKKGERRSITDTAAPILDKHGNVTGVVLVLRDVTEQLRTEKELLKIKKLESIGLLAGGIAHDYNNILTAILGNIQLSLMDSDLSGKTRNFLKQASKASHRAKDLTRQLLTFAKGGLPVKETASLAGLIRDSADFTMENSKIDCRYLLPDDLWPVDIDKGQMGQVIHNLILNALDAMPHGGVLEVSCRNVSSGSPDHPPFAPGRDLVAMDIKDTGVGIAENIIDKIFDPYFTTKEQGAGLGLAISHSIVKRHGGQICVESTPGQGSTFTVYLTASPPTTSSLSPPPPSPSTLPLDNKPSPGTDKVSPFAKKLRIIIMDDEEMIRDITGEMLNDLGHKTFPAKDGKEALEIYKKAMKDNAPIDLTIMDLTIPGGMGGKEAVEKLLEINPEAKAVVSSGYSNDPVMADCKKYGFYAALAKPSRLQDFKNLINRIADKNSD
ncbi:MAG: ATP-binding protein [Desulfobacterium sp.]|nr:ATP-binding protein [Desulfobacterium sp.]